MSYYLNPPDKSAEAWLLEHGVIVTESSVRTSAGIVMVPVCLVDNGWMKAAGICYDHRERDVFLYPCGRPKTWYLVPRALLVPFCALLGLDADA